MLDLTDPVEVLRSLVSIASMNPMGGVLDRPGVGEAALTDHLEAMLLRMGSPVRRQGVSPGRENLLVRFDGAISPDRGGAVLLFDAHQDTVPCEGMTIPPWTPTVREGRLYGRGACDVKGPMAAMIAALARLREAGRACLPTVVLAFTVDEESGFSGAHALVRGLEGELSDFVPRRPDAALVAEPTDLAVVTAHKGVMRWRCTTHGRAAHSAQPQQGVNAIYRMAGVLQAVERYQRETIGHLATHPLCGPGTISVGMVYGGNSVNTVPASCTIEIDRRLSPREEAEAARRHLIEAVEAATRLGDAVEHGTPFLCCPPLSDEHNGRLADRLLRAVGPVLGERSAKVGVAYATEAAWLSQAGIPSVVFGPGSIQQAHTVDEWISLEELERGTQAYQAFLSDEAAWAA